jgi:hypothetical protein
MEYRRNWDKIPVSSWAVNEVHDFADLTTYPVTEPVTAAELAGYLLLSSYNTALLEMFISDARARIEAAADVSLVAHTYKVIVSTVSPFKLPYGAAITDFKDYAGTVVTDYVFENGYINSPYGEFNTITYTTTPLPTEVTKMPVIRLAAFMFENRGDEVSDTVLSKKAHDLSTHFSRKIWLI